MITHRNSAPVSPERVAVLGARGFIGAALVSRLEAMNIPVFASTSDSIDLAAAEADSALAARLRPSDSVVMLSAITPDKGRDRGALMKNMTMMHNVCSALEKVGCAHLVYFSSDAVYDSGAIDVSEDTPPSPRDLYGVMHLARELMARTVGEVPLLIVRPTLVYGLDDTHNSYGVNRFLRAAAKEGKISLFGNGEETRDHICIEDLVKLTVQCMLRRTTGILNAVTGVSHSFREVAEIVARQFEGEIEIVTTPRANPITHRRYRPEGVLTAFPDFQFTPLEEGIQRTRRQMVKAA